MTDTQLSFFEIVRSGLWETAPSLSVSLTEADWERLYLMAHQQAVVGIFYNGVCKLGEGTKPPSSVLLKLAAAAERIEQRNHHLDEVQRAILSFFRAKGLHPLVLKGQTLCNYYPHPEQRMCGDIDIFLPSEKENLKALSLVNGTGTRIQHSPDGSWTFTYKGVTIEIHRHAFDLISHKQERAILKRMMASSTIKERLAPDEELLMLILHILKHCLGPGVGLKQLCDLATAFRSLDGIYDKERLSELFRYTHIVKWSRQICSFIVNILGVPTECVPTGVRTPSDHSLLKIILNGGNFGQHAFGRQKALQGGDVQRKLSTVFFFICHFSFAIRYAPRKVLVYIYELTVGNHIHDNKSFKHQ